MSADPKAATPTASRQDDYPAAARRHMFDATVLKGQQHYDGAAYLAGYVVECSLKTLIEMESGPVKRVHDLARLRDAISDLSRQADARTARLPESWRTSCNTPHFLPGSLRCATALPPLGPTRRSNGRPKPRPSIRR